jgi:hypothetical protein
MFDPRRFVCSEALMNRYRVRAMFPIGADLDRLKAGELKRRVEAIAGAAIDELGRDGRDLDEWEREQLAGALAYLHAGLLQAALTTLWWSLLSPGERPAEGSLRLPNGATRFPIAKFRQALSYAQHAELGPFANDALDRRAWLDRLSGVFK